MTTTQENKAGIDATTNDVRLDQTPTDAGRTNLGGIEVDQTPTDTGRTNLGGIEDRRQRVWLAAIPRSKREREIAPSAAGNNRNAEPRDKKYRDKSTKKSGRSMFRLTRLDREDAQQTKLGPAGPLKRGDQESAAFTRSGVMGSSRSRRPVAFAKAFASAEDVGGREPSPAP
jgi:hypothetical protein